MQGRAAVEAARLDEGGHVLRQTGLKREHAAWMLIPNNQTFPPCYSSHSYRNSVRSKPRSGTMSPIAPGITWRKRIRRRSITLRLHHKLRRISCRSLNRHLPRMIVPVLHERDLSHPVLFPGLPAADFGVRAGVLVECAAFDHVSGYHVVVGGVAYRSALAVEVGAP